MKITKITSVVSVAALAIAAVWFAAPTHAASSATWTFGGNSNNWSNPANWSDNAVPDISTDVIIPYLSVSQQPILDQNASVASLTLNNNARLTLNGHNLTFAPGGTFTNNGSLELLGTETLTNFVNDTDSGGISYNGSGNFNNLAAGYNYYGVYFGGGGPSTYTLPAGTTLNTSSYFTNSSESTINAGNSTINVGGSWTNSGNFNAGTSTVNLLNTAPPASLYGSTTFYSLSITTPSYTSVAIQPGSTQTINNNLVLSAPPGGILMLGSPSPGVQWNINPKGSVSLKNLELSDSNNISTQNPLLIPASSSSDGNNTGWDIDAPTVSNLGGANYINGSTSTNATPTLSFDLADTDMNPTVKYAIQIADNATFTSPTVDYTSSLAAPGTFSFSTPTLANGSYYWRVRAIDNGNLSSNWLVANSGDIAFVINASPATNPNPTNQTPTTKAPDTGYGVSQTDPLAILAIYSAISVSIIGLGLTTRYLPKRYN